MTCHDARQFIDAYLDRELDLMRQMEIDEHLEQCEACSSIYESRRALQSALRADSLYFRAPERLRRHIRAAVRPSTQTSSWARVFTPPWVGVALGAAALIMMMVVVGPMRSRGPQDDRVVQDVVSAHVRSLMANHLTDVSSSDQHTVKPWFAGKLDFSPPVADLKDQGFPLVGGRLDYVANRPVAALAYQRGGHFINLFVWPSSSKPTAGEALESRQGYNVLSWTRDGTSYWVVSDLNTTELRQFASLVQAHD